MPKITIEISDTTGDIVPKLEAGINLQQIATAAYLLTRIADKMLDTAEIKAFQDSQMAAKLGDLKKGAHM
jgi:hypothetical protein